MADRGADRVEAFGPEGEHISGFGGTGDGPGEFRSVHKVNCSEDLILVVDGSERLLHWFTPGGQFVERRVAPPTPQGVPFLGEFEITGRSTLLDSWWAASTGPYLEGAVWDTALLVREWTTAGDRVHSYGRPASYDNPVLRRVLNRSFLAESKDTVWVLRQGDASILGFDQRRELVTRISLPVYHRGSEPIIEVGARLGPILRRNKAVYEPNVGDFEIYQDSLFAIIRYTDWRTVNVEGRPGGDFTDHWPRSTIEMVNRNGIVVTSLTTPGRAHAISVSRSGILGLIVEDLETGRISVVLNQPVPRAESP